MKLYQTLLLTFAVLVSGSIYADTAVVSSADTKNNDKSDTTDANEAAIDLKLIKKTVDSAEEKPSTETTQSTETESSSDATHSAHDAMSIEKSDADTEKAANDEEEDEDDEPDEDDC